MASAGTASVDIELNFDNVDSEVDAAIAGLEPAPIEVPVDADVSEVDAALAGLEAEPIDIPVSAEVEEAEAEIAGIDGEEVVMPVTADTDQAQASVDELSSSFQDLAGGLASGGASGLLDGFAGAAAGAGFASSAAATGGIALLGVGIQETVTSFGEAEVVVAETESMLASMGGGAVTTAAHIGELSQSIMEYSGYSDEAVQQGANTLLMFDNINSQPLFDRALEGAADMARRLGTDVPSAARMLGIALQDPEAGMNRLRRAGIVLTEGQKETITAMMETGNVAGAQEIIFAALEGKIGNLAEAYGETLPGEIDKTNERIDEHKEKIGESLAPAYEAALSAIDKFLIGQDAFVAGLSHAKDEIDDFFNISDSTKNFGPMLGESLKPFDDALGDTAGSAEALEEAISSLSSEIDDYLSGIFSVPDAQQALRQSFSELSEAMDTGTWDEQADAMQGVVEDHAALIDAQNRQHASQEELDLTTYASIAALNDMHAAGVLTADQVAVLTEQILDVPRTSSTAFSQPGLTGGITNAEKFAQKAKEADKLSPSTPFDAPGLSDAYSKSVDYLRTLDSLDGKVITSTFKTIGSAIGKNARGTESASPGLSWVGEEGPELIALQGGERIWSNRESMAMAGAAAGSVTNQYTLHVTPPAGANAGEFAQAVMDAIRDHERANGSGWRSN